MRYLVLIGLLTALMTCPLSFTSAHAGGFEFSEELSFSESFGYAKNNGSNRDLGPNVAGGLFMGTLLEYKKGENKMLGVLGFAAVGATPVGEGLNVAYSITACPITFFDDRIHPCYGYNFTDGAGMLYVGTSPFKF